MTYIRHLLKAYPRIVLLYPYDIGIVLRNDTEYAARQRYAHRQMGTHSNVRRHVRHHLA